VRYIIKQRENKMKALIIALTIISTNVYATGGHSNREPYTPNYQKIQKAPAFKGTAGYGALYVNSSPYSGYNSPAIQKYNTSNQGNLNYQYDNPYKLNPVYGQY
jgi:hypothetical protein